MSLPTTTIRDMRRDNLVISEDTGDEGERIAVLLYIPDTNKFAHSHIELNRVQAHDLHAWLTKFLEAV